MMMPVHMQNTHHMLCPPYPVKLGFRIFAVRLVRETGGRGDTRYRPRALAVSGIPPFTSSRFRLRYPDCPLPSPFGLMSHRSPSSRLFITAFLSSCSSSSPVLSRFSSPTWKMGRLRPAASEGSRTVFLAQVGTFVFFPSSPASSCRLVL
ncbi:cAMP and cAMP-inhibited cGMP 3',5'-cyclic phosphodiesterase 10A isoform X4 [Tachysurus ichikawai]